MKYYNKADMVQNGQEQVRVYRDLAKGLKSIIPVIQKFDGKVINVKINRDLKEVLGKDFYATIKKTYDNKTRIEINAQNRSYTVKNTDSYRGTSYVDNYSSYVDFDTNEKRLIAENVIVAINAEVISLNKRANKLEDSINNIDTIDDEYKNICDMIKAFNNKMPYEIRDSYKFDRVY